MIKKYFEIYTEKDFKKYVIEILKDNLGAVVRYNDKSDYPVEVEIYREDGYYGKEE